LEEELRKVSKKNSLMSVNPELAREWHSTLNLNLTPLDVFSSCAQKVWWQCQTNKNHFWEASLNKRSNGRGCPYCSGNKAHNTNCLWVTHPEVAKMLFEPNVGYDITFGSNRKEEFVCPNCLNKTEKKNVNSVVRQGLSCHMCSDGVSYPEKFMTSFLTQLNIQFTVRKSFDWSDRKIYDFYIPLLDCIIETHGGQHYSEGFSGIGGRTLFEEQENDRLKEKLAINNNINNYIIIDCRISDLEYIKNNIIKSYFPTLKSINQVDWIKCHKYSCKSIVKKACDIWSSGVENIADIAIVLNVCESTARTYLKKGYLLKWCNYNVDENRLKHGKKNGKKNGVPIVKLSLDGSYICRYESSRAAQKELSINNISRTLNLKAKSAGGFKWMFKEDYDKYIALAV